MSDPLSYYDGLKEGREKIQVLEAENEALRKRIAGIREALAKFYPLLDIGPLNEALRICDE